MTDDDLKHAVAAVRVAAQVGLPNGAHETAMTAATGLSLPRAWAMVNRAIDDAEVIAAVPVECGRLRRLREARRAVRRARASA